MRMQGEKRRTKKELSVKKGTGLNFKLIGVLIPAITVVLAGILFIIYANTSKIILAKSEESLRLSTNSAVNNVTAWMNTARTALDQQRDTLQFSDMDPETEMAYIKHTAGQYDAYPAGIYLGLLDGSISHASFVPGPDYVLFDKGWYQDGLKSEDFVFGAVYYDDDSKSNVVGAYGVLKNSNGVVRGVAAADIYLDAISQIVSTVTLEETGGLFLADLNTGMIIGHKDPAILGAVLAEQTDPMYSYVGTLLKNGATGLQTLDQGGDQIYLQLENVPNSRWTAVAYVPGSEVMADLNTLTKTTVTIAIVALFILLGIVIVLLRRIIIQPIRQIDKVARRIAEGKLDESIAYRSGDELGQLTASFNKTVDRLRDYVNYIDEISSVLDEVAGGNLDFRLTYDYAGEFSKVKIALEHISLSLNDTLGQINMSAEQVSVGAGQVSDGAQALSQGATEQASSIDELASTISEVAEHVQVNAGNATLANNRADAMGLEIAESNRQMQKMLASMHEIGDASGKIGKIMKTIEDIAFQTNILALNAAVEAARAGAAGKGFAVVADEVRNLANKSQEASKNTASLIENSLRATENGIKIAGDTADALSLVVQEVEDVTAIIAKISKASGEQAVSIAQVNEGVNQISAVVQTNSATAEESAAASEELSAQAAMMKRLAGQFRLKDSEASTCGIN